MLETNKTLRLTTMKTKQNSILTFCFNSWTFYLSPKIFYTSDACDKSHVWTEPPLPIYINIWNIWSPKISLKIQKGPFFGNPVKWSKWIFLDWLKSQESLVARDSGLGERTTAGRLSCTESPLRQHRWQDVLIMWIMWPSIEGEVWKKKTVQYKTTSTGPRYHLPILEMLHVLLWDDRQLWVLSLWWNIPTGDMQHACRNFQSSIIISKRCQWERMSWPMGDQQTESTSSLQTGRNQGLTTPMNSGLRTESLKKVK